MIEQDWHTEIEIGGRRIKLIPEIWEGGLVRGRINKNWCILDHGMIMDGDVEFWSEPLGFPPSLGLTFPQTLNMDGERPWFLHLNRGRISIYPAETKYPVREEEIYYTLVNSRIDLDDVEKQNDVRIDLARLDLMRRFYRQFKMTTEEMRYAHQLYASGGSLYKKVSANPIQLDAKTGQLDISP